MTSNVFIRFAVKFIFILFKMKITFVLFVAALLFVVKGFTYAGHTISGDVSKQVADEIKAEL